MQQLTQLLNKAGSTIETAMLQAIIKVETGGSGFDAKTGKILIQFEPRWYKKHAPYAPSGVWSLNKVERQSKEWIAFNDAFRKDKVAAMLSTSIGLPQIMGFHFARLGYTSVGAMWDDFKVGLDNQILALIKFIETDKHLLAACLSKDFTKIADIYNGTGWPEIAKKYGREPYPISLKKEYLKAGGIL